MGWMLLESEPETEAAMREVDVSDVAADPVVQLQLAMGGNLFCIAMCFFAPACAATLWGEQFFAAVLVAGCLRYVCVLHFTALVNSAAHLWGERPYDPKSNPAENSLVSFFAIGEGWHNWHHAFPYDYAASELGISSQYNPSKLFIDTCCALGLAGGRKRATSIWNKRKARFATDKSDSEHISSTEIADAVTE